MKKQWLAAIAAVSFCASAIAAEAVTEAKFTDQSVYLGPVSLSFSKVFSEDPTVLTNKQCKAIFTQFALDQTGSFQSKTVSFGPSKTTAIKLNDDKRLRVWQSQISSSELGPQPLPFFATTLVTVDKDSEKHTGLGNFIAGPCHGVVKAIHPMSKAQ